VFPEIDAFVRLVFALNDDPFFRDALGAAFVDYYVHVKNAEIASRPRCRTGSIGNISRCFEAVVGIGASILRDAAARLLRMRSCNALRR
jgi:hypothetical protein